MALTEADKPRTPDWWLLRLGRKLRDRHDQLDFWKGYYRGDGQRLPIGPSGAVRAYLDFQQKARTNFCMLPVEADVHRLRANGITDGTGKAIPEAWRWWLQNKLNARQKVVYRTALSQAESYVSVGEHPRHERRPLIVPEHPRQVIHETDPATGEVMAALKAYHDDVDGIAVAVVATDDGKMFRYETEQRSAKARLPWGANNWTLVKDKERTFDRPPLVPFTYQPDLDEDPEPVFARIIDIQDRINLGVLNRMTAERYSAFRQKYVTGATFKKEVDQETGLETVVNPYKPDPGALWANENANARFGEFSQTDLMGYLKVYETDIRTLFVLTSTPAYYMPGDLINVGSDTVVALDTNHVAKIHEEQDNFGESWEEVFQLAAQVAGYDGDLSDAEIWWKDARQLNPAVVADMGSKRRAMGYPLTMVAEDMGDAPARVERLRTEAAAEQMLANAAARRTQGSAQAAFREPGQREQA